MSRTSSSRQRRQSVSDLLALCSDSPPGPYQNAGVMGVNTSGRRAFGRSSLLPSPLRNMHLRRIRIARVPHLMFPFALLLALTLLGLYAVRFRSPAGYLRETSQRPGTWAPHSRRGPWLLGVVADMDRDSARAIHRLPVDNSPSSHLARIDASEQLPISSATAHPSGSSPATSVQESSGRASGLPVDRVDAYDLVRPSAEHPADAWVSVFKRARVALDAQGRPHVLWLDSRLLVTDESVKGRGMELSEMRWYAGKLVVVDDRTGALYPLEVSVDALSAEDQYVGMHGKSIRETAWQRSVWSERLAGIIGGLLGSLSRDRDHPVKGSTTTTYGKDSVPQRVQRLRQIVRLLDGDGSDVSKRLKAEWMVVKDGELIVGGHGRELTDPTDGRRVLNRNPMWVKHVSRHWSVRSVNWTGNYDLLRRELRMPFPGYLMHEAVLWSTIRREWLFLPRRVSPVAYDGIDVQTRGGRVVLVASENFESIRHFEIVGLPRAQGTRGFSSAVFVPGSQETWVAALRTEESESRNGSRLTSSFLSIFDLTAPFADRLLLPEERFSDEKFEGMEWL